jgi:hypothetical protein
MGALSAPFVLHPSSFILPYGHGAVLLAFVHQSGLFDTPTDIRLHPEIVKHNRIAGTYTRSLQWTG